MNNVKYLSVIYKVYNRSTVNMEALLSYFICMHAFFKSQKCWHLAGLLHKGDQLHMWEVHQQVFRRRLYNLVEEIRERHMRE